MNDDTETVWRNAWDEAYGIPPDSVEACGQPLDEFVQEAVIGCAARVIAREMALSLASDTSSLGQYIRCMAREVERESDGDEWEGVRIGDLPGIAAHVPPLPAIPLAPKPSAKPAIAGLLTVNNGRMG